MTSNQLIVLGELQKPAHAHVLKEASQTAKELQKSFNISEQEMPAFVVDCAVRLGHAARSQADTRTDGPSGHAGHASP